MQEYIIDVGQVEELQTTKDLEELENIFTRAKANIVQGGIVSLVRKNKDRFSNKFDELTTEEDLNLYKKSVFKYL